MIQSDAYHIAVKLLRDHGLEVVPIRRDADGPVLDALSGTLDELHRAGRRPSLFYTIPTFHNPTGSVLPLDRRVELVRLAASRGLLIVEDDAYRELSYGEPPPPSLWSLAEPGSVVRVGSFSKTLAPGLRLGFLTGEPSEPAMNSSREAGVHFIAAGHYATETFGVRRLGELVADRFGIAHEFIDLPNPV